MGRRTDPGNKTPQDERSAGRQSTDKGREGINAGGVVNLSQNTTNMM